VLEKAELTLIFMLSKTKKVITTPPPVLCSVASRKLFYSITLRAVTLSLLFVPPAKGGGMEIFMIMYAQLIGHSPKERMVLSYDVEKDVANSGMSFDEYIKKVLVMNPEFERVYCR